MIETGGNVPVYKPDIIAMLVFAHFFEQHASALESAVIFTCKQVAGELLAFDLQLADFF